MRVCWISAGVSSFMAGVLGKADEWIYIDVADQHPDSMRFIRDCEKAIGREIKILRSSKYRDVADVCRKAGMTNSVHGAPCTGMLKKAVRKKWESEQYDNGRTDLTYIWGYDVNEKRRAENIRRNFPEFTHEFLLIDRSLSKAAVHGLFDSMFGFPRPKMYELGYSNNNCIGCVKGGKGYWNKIRADFPEVFATRAKLEREVGGSFINGVYLDELPPDAGRMSEEIVQDCDIMCHIAKNEVENEH